MATISPGFDAFPSNAERSAFTFAFARLVMGGGSIIAPQCTVAHVLFVLAPPEVVGREPRAMR
jgi:hypothetical protein